VVSMLAVVSFPVTCPPLSAPTVSNCVLRIEMLGVTVAVIGSPTQHFRWCTETGLRWALLPLRHQNDHHAVCAV